MSANNGGPAFPVQEVFDERRGEVTQYGSAGMTLRDYFAAKAMQALVQTPMIEWPETERESPSVSVTAYCIADEMLKARAL